MTKKFDEYLLDIAKNTIKNASSDENIQTVKQKTDRFMKFCYAWYDDGYSAIMYDKYYTQGWARRFENNTEYLGSDGDNIKRLLKIDGEKKGMNYFAWELATFNRIPFEDAMEEVKERAYGKQTQKGYKTHKPKTLADKLSKNFNKML